MAGAGGGGGRATLAARARAALERGCDFILVCNDPVSAFRPAPALADLRWQAESAFTQRLPRCPA